MSRIDDGHPTTISFGSTPSGETLLFWEKEVTPPGLDGGGPINTTTMRNTIWRTMMPKKLVTLTTGSFVAAYDPAVLDQLVAMLNVQCQIVITHEDGSTWTFWGWLDKFTLNACVEGDQPTATCSIEPANQNTSGEEVGPVYTEAA